MEATLLPHRRDFKRSFKAKGLLLISLTVIILIGTKLGKRKAKDIDGYHSVILRSLLSSNNKSIDDINVNDISLDYRQDLYNPEINDGELEEQQGNNSLINDLDEGIDDNISTIELTTTTTTTGSRTTAPAIRTTIITTEATPTSTSSSVEEEEICTEPAYHEFPTDAFTSHQRAQGAIIFHIILTVYMFVALAVVCDVYFVASLDKICERLHMSSDVAGATFMAAGSSAPELFTSIIGVFVAKGDVGVGTIVGSAVFNILFVIGACGIFVNQAVYLSHWPLLRDSICYAISIIALIASITDSRIKWYEAAIMLILYMAYIALMKFNNEVRLWVYQRIDIEKILGTEEDTTASALPVDNEKKYYGNYEIFQNEPMKPPINNYGSDKNNIAMTSNKPKNIIQVDKYVLHSRKKISFEDACFRFMKQRRFRGKCRFRAAVYIIMLERRKLVADAAFMKRQQMRTWSSSYDGSDGHSFTSARFRRSMEESELIDDWKRIRRIDDGYVQFIQWLLMFPLNALLYYTVPDCRKPKWDSWYLVTFIASIVWIAAFSYIMVWMVTLIGFTMGIPDSIMGITFLAAGTSVPDAMASVMVARQGQGDMAVSNTIGSNVFDVLIGLALPWFLMTSCVNPGSYVHINSNGMIFSVLLLFLSLIFTLGAIHKFKWKLDKRLGFLFIAVYAIFLTFSILIEFNVFGYVNAPMCREP